GRVDQDRGRRGAREPVALRPTAASSREGLGARDRAREDQIERDDPEVVGRVKGWIGRLDGFDLRRPVLARARLVALVRVVLDRGRLRVRAGWLGGPGWVLVGTAGADGGGGRDPRSGEARRGRGRDQSFDRAAAEHRPNCHGEDQRVGQQRPEHLGRTPGHQPHPATSTTAAPTRSRWLLVRRNLHARWSITSLLFGLLDRIFNAPYTPRTTVQGQAVWAAFPQATGLTSRSVRPPLPAEGRRGHGPARARRGGYKAGGGRASEQRADERLEGSHDRRGVMLKRGHPRRQSSSGPARVRRAVSDGSPGAQDGVFAGRRRARVNCCCEVLPTGS